MGINNEVNERFLPSRGLRQGDPLSPYLFCAEGFSTLLNEAKRIGIMRGLKLGEVFFAINHLFFADDCILFEDASKDGATVARDIIKEYEAISG